MNNKCEELKIAHAWRGGSEMYGFQVQTTETCANCGLKRTKCSDFKEWWNYSDGRPAEEINTMRPV